MRYLLTFGIAASLFIAVIYIFFCNTYKAQNDEIVLIDTGSSVNQIASILEEKKLIYSAFYFKVYTKYQAKINNKYIIAGEYQFSKDASFFQIMDSLTQGKRLIRKVTIPEGYSIIQIVKLLDNTYGLTGDLPMMQDCELMPDTYYYFYGDSKEIIIKAMQKAFQQFISEHPATLENLIIASLVEKETSAPSERALVASVYYNRLKVGMPLQADPTVIYAISRGEKLYRELLSKDLKYPSPYNTYIYKGLPPSPIACSGKASILAALQPASTEYLYFVSDGNGGHNFSKTLKEHNINVSNFRKTK